LVTILAVLGVIVTLLAFAYALYSDREPGDPHRAAIASIRRWRSRSFEQSLAFSARFVDSYCAQHAAANGDPDPRSPQADDLFRWAVNAVLTAAARIHPFSQGKANLFSVQSLAEDGAAPSANLRSLSFVGPFPLAQLREVNGAFRDMPVTTHAAAMSSVAGQAYIVDSILLEVVAHQRYRSDEEKRLGTTHILAIPVGHGLNGAQEGSLAVLAVDLRIPRRYHWLYRDERTRRSRRLHDRAEKVQALARRLATLPEAATHA
jgi:hypothetical protein